MGGAAGAAGCLAVAACVRCWPVAGGWPSAVCSGACGGNVLFLWLMVNPHGSGKDTPSRISKSLPDDSTIPFPDDCLWRSLSWGACSRRRAHSQSTGRMIRGVIIVNNHGKPRLVKFYQTVVSQKHAFFVFQLVELKYVICMFSAEEVYVTAQHDSASSCPTAGPCVSRRRGEDSEMTAFVMSLYYIEQNWFGVFLCVRVFVYCCVVSYEARTTRTMCYLYNTRTCSPQQA